MNKFAMFKYKSYGQIWFIMIIILASGNLSFAQTGHDSEEHKLWTKWVKFKSTNKAQGNFVITKDGKSNTTILVGENTDGTVVEYAAKQLQQYLNNICGLMIPIEQVDSENLMKYHGKQLILLGESMLTHKFGISLNESPIDGFIIKSTPDFLAIVGRDGKKKFNTRKRYNKTEAGTLHGVFTLLQQIGIIIFFEREEMEIIPKMDKIEIPYCEFRDAPYFPFHLVYGKSIKWTSAVKGGGAKSYFNGHTFKKWPDKYKDKHPEWFLTDPFISEEQKFLDFSKPGLQKEIVNDAQKYFNNGNDYYTLIQNDGFFYERVHYLNNGLKQPAYLALHSESIMKNFVRIAEELNKTHPEKKVVLCAYDSYSMPPQGLKKLPPNTILSMALRRHNNVLETGKAENRELLSEWLKLEPNEVYWWEYFIAGDKYWFNDYYEMFPRFIPHVISEDIKFLANIRKDNPALKGEWFFSNYRKDHLNGWCNLPNNYLVSKLLWNPFIDIDTLLNGIYSDVFGNASNEMAEFYALSENAWMNGAQKCTDANPHDFMQDNSKVARCRAMGDHFFDSHFEREDFLPAWPDSIIIEMDKLINKAIEKTEGTANYIQVKYVMDGFNAFKKIL